MPQNVYLQLLAAQRGAPNAAQAVGSGLQGLSDNLTEAQKLQMAMQEAVQRRQQAILANKANEYKLEQDKVEAAETQRVRGQQAKGREMIFKKRLTDLPPGQMPTEEELAALEPDAPPASQAPAGRDPRLTAAVDQSVAGIQPQPGQMPEQRVQGYGQAPAGYADTARYGNFQPDFDPNAMSREDEIRTMAEHEMIEPKDYLTATDPARDPEFVMRKLAAQAGLNLDKAEDAREFRWKMAKFLEAGRDRRAAAQDKAKPKGYGGMPLVALGDTEIKTIKDIRRTASLLRRIDEAANNIANLRRGPFAGRAGERNPYDGDIASLDKLVNQTIPSMARGVFGEVGVLTDDDVARYRGMFATIRTDPTVATRIMEDLKKTLGDAWYLTVDSYDKANRNVAGFDPHWSFEEIGNIGEPAPGGGGMQPAAGSRAPAPADTAGAMSDEQRILERMKALKGAKPAQGRPR